jgi:ribose-phosphate pyrophosphokinase
MRSPPKLPAKTNAGEQLPGILLTLGKSAALAQKRFQAHDKTMDLPARPLLFSTMGYQALGQTVGVAAALESGTIVRENFPDGELGLRIDTAVTGRDCALLGGTDNDAASLELYDTACGLVAAGARTLDLIVPYFGYGTADRAVHPGDVVTTKTRALLFSSVPRAAAGNRIFLLDAHNEGLPYYFEGPLRPFHLYAEAVLLPAIAALGGDDFVLGSVDAGRAKWVAHFADRLGVDTALVLKRRLDGRRTEVLAVSAPVSGRAVVIYDDMIRSGGSLIAAARAYHEAGARSVDAVVTHGVLPGEAREDLRRSGLLRSVTVTDSHPRARLLADDFLHVVSVAQILAAPFIA